MTSGSTPRLTQAFIVSFIAAAVAFAPGRTAVAQKKSGIDAQAFEPSVRIQDDFYRAVNGSWLRDTEIPSDKSNYGSFTVLADLSEERILQIIEDAAAASAEMGSDAQKVGDLYQSFMNEERIKRSASRRLLRNYFKSTKP